MMITRAQLLHPHSRIILVASASVGFVLALLLSRGLSIVLSSVADAPVAVAMETPSQVVYTGVIAWVENDSIRIVDGFGVEHMLSFDSSTRIIDSDRTASTAAHLRVYEHVHVTGIGTKDSVQAQEIAIN